MAAKARSGGSVTARMSRVLLVAIVACAALPVHADILSPALGLEELAQKVDLVCKATVVADRVVTDEWFPPLGGYEARETELRIVSVIQGTASDVIRFRHYTSVPTPQVNVRQSYELVHGRTYLVFARQAPDGTYRQWSKGQTTAGSEGVLLAANAEQHSGATIRETVWSELLALLESSDERGAIEAIQQLDTLSGGGALRPWPKLKEFERSHVLAAIRPLLANAKVPVATAAVTVFGAESPYFDTSTAPYWLAGMGKGRIPGLYPREPTAAAAADVAVKELLDLAVAGTTPQLRALAIRTLAPSREISAAMIGGWLRDPNLEVRAAAVLASADRADREAIASGSHDGSPEVRQAAALAVGFAQDPRLIPLLGTLLGDQQANVRAAAALSLLSLAPSDAEPLLKANLAHEFRPLFINALARADAQPYLALLAENIKQGLAPNMPTNWWGGSIPAGDSWGILYGFVKSRPTTELAGGALDRSLDALEGMQWYSSAEPRALYALYLSRDMHARAQRFREATRKSLPYNIDEFFDMADKDPETFIQ
jgi:hypothetical protein